MTSFANRTRSTGSAIHWPLYIHANQGDMPDGVVSVQAYAHEAYHDTHLSAVEWFALRVQDKLRRESETKEAEIVLERAVRTASANQTVMDVRRFVRVLEDLLPLVETPSPLHTEIRRRQVELTQWAMTPPTADDPLLKAITDLSERELEVLVFVSQGLSNKDVAAALSISTNTVKNHLNNVYALGVLTRRAEVTAALSTIQAAWMARRG